MTPIALLTQELYADRPDGPLYHYTTFSGLLGIVEARELWASDIRYMNDSTELRYTAELLRLEVGERCARGHDRTGLLACFADWLTHRMTNGHILFAASFRSHGNLLSQWRGYSVPGKGVSLGFAPQHIIDCAKAQHFQIGRCIYDADRQQELIVRVVDGVEVFAESGKKAGNSDSAAADLFHHLESDLLRIAAVIKHPSFAEEEEWRIVSPVFSDPAHPAIRYREGHAMLVPYIGFQLEPDAQHPITLEHLFLGPTPNREGSMNSLAMFLAKNGMSPTRGIDYCRIPFRQR